MALSRSSLRSQGMISWFLALILGIGTPPGTASAQLESLANLSWGDLASGLNWGLTIRGLWKEFQDNRQYEQDKAAYERDKAEFLRQLTELQNKLKSVDVRMAAEIGTIRSELADRVTFAEFRQGLNSMEQRFNGQLSLLAVRLDRLDRLTAEQRREIDKLKERFAFLPPVKVSPLLRDVVIQGKPLPHPLIAEWLNLLNRSEVNRLRLARWAEQYQDGAPPIAGLDEEKTRLQKETTNFRNKVVAASRALRDDRAAKLSLYVRESHPEVLAVDQKLAAVEWLLPLTLPVSEGNDAGRLPIIPNVFLGPYASELVCIHLDHGGSPNDLIPIYQQLVFVEAEKSQRLQDPTGTIMRGLPFQGFERESVQIRDAVIDTGEYLRACRSTNDRLSNLSPDLGPRSSQVLNLRAQQNRQMELIVDRSEQLQKLLADSLRNYVKALQEYRYSAANMQLFRQRYLAYLAWIAQELYVPPEANELEVRAAWQRASTSPRLITLVTRLDELKSGRQLAPTRTPEPLPPIPRPVIRDGAVPAAAVDEETVRLKRAYESILTAPPTNDVNAPRFRSAAEYSRRANQMMAGNPGVEELREVIRCCSHAIALDPEFRDAYELRARAYEKLGKPQFAALDRANARRPDFGR